MPDGSVSECVYGFSSVERACECAKVNGGSLYEAVVDGTGVYAVRKCCILLDSFEKYRTDSSGSSYEFWDGDTGGSYPARCFDRLLSDSKYVSYIIPMIEVYRHIRKLAWGYWVVVRDGHYHSTERRYVTSYEDSEGRHHTIAVVKCEESPLRQ